MKLKVKFFITPVYPYGNDHYFHEIIALAEGFLELGHEILGNANYWWQPETNSYLIAEDIANNDFDLAIYDYRYVTSFSHLLFRKGYPNFEKNKIHILIDRNDWIQPIWWNNKNYEIFDFIFAGNLYKTKKYEHNIKPWAIGLTNRIIKTIDRFYNPENEREQMTGYNFRVDHNMRGYLLNNLIAQLQKYPSVPKFTNNNFNLELDRFYNKTSINRHNPEYYKTLCTTKLFMAFGGYYDFKPSHYQPLNLVDRLCKKPYYWNYKRLKKSGKDFSNTVFIFQQDNFRFWEVLYSGAVAINLDLEHWNFKLPVMPQLNEHYIGIGSLKANSIERSLTLLTDEELATISKQGRQWVFDNYSPKAQAKRVLEYIIKK